MKFFLKSLFTFYYLQSGQSLVELLVTIALTSLFLPALLVGFAVTRSGRVQQDQRLQAISFLREAQEAVRVVRESGWTNIASFTPGQAYHPVVSGGTWTLASG